MNAVTLTFCLLAVFLWLLPVFVAGRRDHPSKAGILVLDLLLGWTVLGWIIALVWAFSGRSEARPARQRESDWAEQMRQADQQRARL